MRYQRVMNEPAAPPAYTVPPRIAVLSIVLFWAFYFASVTARAEIMDYPGSTEMIDNRIWVSIAGMGFSWLLYLFLRTLCHRTLAIRVAAAFLASVPVAVAYSAVNYLSFELVDPLPPEILATKEPYKVVGPMQEIADNSIHWYFFVSCWAVLYLALSYAGEARNAEREKARLRAAAQAAELRALRYQINPHFLFNTLNSLSSLVLTGKRDEAEGMILNLSAFFRTSLSAAPADDVRLAEEIALQKMYLDIEAVRFPDRLRVAIDVAGDVQEACVPALILQPLVENAIKYGVAPARRPITVTIRARRERDRLQIAVENEGEPAGRSSATSGTGVGLRNVHDRLRARFGSDAAIHCEAAADGGYVARLDMPWVRNGC